MDQRIEWGNSELASPSARPELWILRTIPEPGSTALGGTALGLLALVKRRRNTAPE